MIAPATSRRHLRWPTERFYWAVLDATFLSARSSGRRARRQQLGYLFEAQLPLPIDDVQAVYRRLGVDRCLACGVRRSALEDVIGDGIVTLAPQGLPAFMQDDVNPATLNVLVGTCEPKSIRRWRRIWVSEIVLLALIAAALGFAGFERRCAAVNSETVRLQTLRQTTYGLVLDPAAGSAQPPAIRLTAEMRRLRKTRAGPAPDLQPADAAMTLAQLFDRWPTRAGTDRQPDAAFLRAETIAATPASLTIRAAVPDSAAAQELSDALRGLRGWRLGPPQFSRTGESVSVVLRFEPESKEIEP